MASAAERRAIAIALDEVSAPLALCSSTGYVEAVTKNGLVLLTSLGIVDAVPGQLPAELWDALGRREPGDAVEWRPPADQQNVLGCTRYRHGSGYLLLMKEVSDKHAEISRRLHRQRLEATGRLIASIAHELRNSVASIVYCADYLSVAGPTLSDEGLRETTQEILDASGRLQSTVAGLLDYARLGPSLSVPVSLRDVIARSQGFLRAVFKHGSHRLEIELPADADWVQGNSIVIEQIFVNLLLNAAEAALAPMRVVVRAERATNAPMVRIEVRDDGPGIAPRLHELVFQPFFTTRELGTGLGLTNAREAAESLGGSLELEPSEVGASFVVMLPAAESTEEP